MVPLLCLHPLIHLAQNCFGVGLLGDTFSVHLLRFLYLIHSLFLIYWVSNCLSNPFFSELLRHLSSSSNSLIRLDPPFPYFWPVLFNSFFLMIGFYPLLHRFVFFSGCLPSVHVDLIEDHCSVFALFLVIFVVVDSSHSRHSPIRFSIVFLWTLYLYGFLSSLALLLLQMEFDYLKPTFSRHLYCCTFHFNLIAYAPLK